MTSDQHNEDDASTSRKTTDFTIEHILNRAGSSTNTNASTNSHYAAHTSSTLHYASVQLTSTESDIPFTSAPSVSVVSEQYTNDKCYQQAQELNDSFECQTTAGLPFTWLHCTRYCPPKVPRKKEGPQKRQLGRHPRIPFTSHQLSILEDKFKQSPYLSSEEVTRISQILDLADIRVKIWFQNRRARERREKLIVDKSPNRNTPPSSPDHHPKIFI